MKVGRPSKYDPKYCEMLIEDMRQGFSFEAFADVIGVNRDTLYEWVKVYPEFSDAKKKAFSASLRHWEGVGIDLAKGKLEKGNAASWVFNMKNRFHWRDRQEVEQVINANAGFTFHTEEQDD